jgi:hypothetical protein
MNADVDRARRFVAETTQRLRDAVWALAAAESNLARAEGKQPFHVVDVIDAMRAAINRLHTQPDSEDDPDWWDYRHHDEHNADVREDISQYAEILSDRIGTLQLGERT